MMISLFLSSCHEKAAEALYIGRNPDSLSSFPCFRVFRLTLTSDFDLLLATFHQAEIIVVEHLIQGRNNEAWVGVEPLTFDHGRRKNDAPDHSATLPKIDVEGLGVAIDVEGLELNSQAGRIGHTVANGSPPLRRFFGAALPRR